MSFYSCVNSETSKNYYKNSAKIQHKNENLYTIFAIDCGRAIDWIEFPGIFKWTYVLFLYISFIFFIETPFDCFVLSHRYSKFSYHEHKRDDAIYSTNI
jgi:hypothetical protein